MVPIHRNHKTARIAVCADAHPFVSPTHRERVTATLAVTTALTGIPRTTLYRMLGQGQLRAVKNCRRTLVLWQSVIDYFDSLPIAQFQATNAPASLDHIGLREGDATSPVASRRHRGQRP